MTVEKFFSCCKCLRPSDWLKAAKKVSKILGGGGETLAGGGKSQVTPPPPSLYEPLHVHIVSIDGSIAIIVSRRVVKIAR